jgi:hypothetical protein
MMTAMSTATENKYELRTGSDSMLLFVTVAGSLFDYRHATSVRKFHQNLPSTSISVHGN